jgi:DNA-binding LacI/PurR family transcriptional regulator
MLELSEPPTAVVVASEAQAIGAFLAARDRGWRVPADLSIVGYSDSPYAAYLGLTTIDIPLREIGREATRMLLGAIAEPDATPQTVYQPSRLVVRRTCGAPASR